MAITSSKNQRTQYTQEFTSSGSFICPAGVNEVEIFAVGAGGGGGGGGSSSGNGTAGVATASKDSGSGGGGGAGGQVLKRIVRTTPGTNYTVTIGAGGAGATAGGATANILYNAFLDGAFGAGNSTGWTLPGGSGSIAYTAGSNLIGTSTGALLHTGATNGSTQTLTYDSGTSTSIPFSTVAGEPFILRYSMRENSGNTPQTVTRPSIAWYNGTTLLRTDTALATETKSWTGSETYLWTYYSDSSEFGNFTFGNTAFTNGIPATATRFIFTLTWSTSVTGNWLFDGFVLGSSKYHYGSIGTTSTTYWVDPTNNTGWGLAWNGTTWASPIMTVPNAGQWVAGRVGRKGGHGTNGGNTSFGSLITAYGGGGGGGGGFGGQTFGTNELDAMKGLGLVTGDLFTKSGFAQNGGNGGGGGGYGNVANSSSSSNESAGAGGASTAGYVNTPSRGTIPGNFTINPITAGWYGGVKGYWGGNAAGQSSEYTLTSTGTSTYPLLGGEGTEGFGYGGNGGGSGAYSISSSVTYVRKSTEFEPYAANFFNTQGGAGGDSGQGGVSSGAAQNGSAGANATILGSGGGGGGGGGCPSGTTQGGNTFGNGANGGAGGNGANGFLRVTWWE